MIKSPSPVSRLCETVAVGLNKIPSLIISEPASTKIMSPTCKLWAVTICFDAIFSSTCDNAFCWWRDCCQSWAIPDVSWWTLASTPFIKLGIISVVASDAFFASFSMASPCWESFSFSSCKIRSAADLSSATFCTNTGSTTTRSLAMVAAFRRALCSI